MSRAILCHAAAFAGMDLVGLGSRYFVSFVRKLGPVECHVLSFSNTGHNRQFEKGTKRP